MEYPVEHGFSVLHIIGEGRETDLVFQGLRKTLALRQSLVWRAGLVDDVKAGALQRELVMGAAQEPIGEVAVAEVCFGARETLFRFRIMFVVRTQHHCRWHNLLR